MVTIRTIIGQDQNMDRTGEGTLQGSDRGGPGQGQVYLREDAPRVHQPRGLRPCDARTRSTRPHRSK